MSETAVVPPIVEKAPISRVEPPNLTPQKQEKLARLRAMPPHQALEELAGAHRLTERKYGKGVTLQSPKAYDDPQQQERQDIRTFTKSTEAGRQQRSETATRILEQRGEKNAKSKLIRETTATRDQLTKSADRDQERLDQARSQVENLTHQVRKSEASFMKRTFGAGSIDALRSQVKQLEGDIETTGNNLPASRAEIGRLYKELAQAEAQKVASNKSAQEWLSKFYREQGNKLSEARDRDELEHHKDQHGTVEALARERKEYVVHAISVGQTGGQNNRILSANAEWRDKLAVVVDSKPAVSSSSIRLGEHADTWFPFGVVLKGGRIQDAYHGDGGTSPKSLGDRGDSGIIDINNFRSRLNKRSSGYNELVVGEHPEVAGLYINLDDGISGNTTSFSFGVGGGRMGELKFSEIFGEAQRYGMKVFGFKSGTAHELRLDRRGELIIGEKAISPEEILTEEHQIPEQNVASIHEQALKAVPSARDLSQAA